MSGLCDMLLVLGLTFGGKCAPATPEAAALPADDPAAWSWTKPEPPKPEPKPAPAPNFPPVVVEKTVYVERPAPAQAPASEPKPAPTATQPKPPSAVETALRSAYRDRSAGARAWTEATPSASLPSIGAAAAVKASLPKMPKGPLDMASVVQTEKRSKYEAEGRNSSFPVDNTRIIGEDRVITGVMENGINTQLDGSTGSVVVIQVTRDVYGYHNRYVLLPKGSRLLCAYVSPTKLGDTRTLFRCDRVLMAGSRAEIFGLKAEVTDMQGYLGVTGEVYNRLPERFGTAFALAGISAVVRGAASTSRGMESLANNSDAFTTGSEELAQQLGQVGATALQQTINLKPIIKVRQGTRVQIRPQADWYIAPEETANTSAKK